ncbi:cytochrome P450 monooxygenase-like protein 48 [Elsinoe australis]|uniref:Cytochrome P450 monooxygenase-like protein 48 n=1 Tax=Elsinoe australis TaxID=40998 RepID=A0A4U7ARR4_9PEZI|nr:cytochrome P450 monooxygenase-like protein 48 [Elsinoe australis]
MSSTGLLSGTLASPISLTSNLTLFNLTALTGAALAALCFVVIYRLYFHPLAHLPGPFYARIAGYWRTIRYARGTWHDDILELHAKYGRVVRVAPNEVSVVDENAMRQLYGHGKNAPKTDWYSTWEVPNTAPALFASQDKKVHAFLRKRVSGAYSMSAVLRFERWIQGCLDLMLCRLKQHADRGEIVNMSDWTNAFAFDVVGELAYGEQLGHLRTETDVHNVRKNIYKGFQLMASVGHLPGQSRPFNNPFMTRLRGLFGGPDPFASFQEWTIAKLKARMNDPGSTPREDMLWHFNNMRKADGEPAEFGEVLIEALNIIGAGADTTSIGIRACLFYICSHPAVYQKVRQEVDQYYRDNNLAEPITYLQCQQLRYLGAAIKEATRLLPSIVFQLLRHAPDNFIVDDKVIPPGTPVGISPLAQNRDRAIWGNDADVFRPERWLEDEEKAKYLETANMTFGGSGPRMCIGKNIALVELHKAVAQLIHNFDMEIVDRERPWRIASHWFAYQHDFNMRLKFREGRDLRTIET